MPTQDPPHFTTTLPHRAADPFRLLVESVRDYAIFLLDSAGRIASWNIGAERIKGYPADEVLGQPFATLFTPEDAACGKPQRDMDAALTHGRYEEEGVRPRKDGSTFWAICTVTALHEGDRHIGFAVIVRDISERKQSEDRQRQQNLALAGPRNEVADLMRVEQDLRDREGRFRAMLENSSDVISIHDPLGRMVYQSPSIKPVLGYDEGELLGHLVLDYIHPDDVGFTAEKIAQIMARPGKQPPFLTRFRHKNAEWRWCECTGTNLLKNPAVGGILFNARDVTDRKRAEEELRRSERRYRTLVTATSKLIWTATAAGEIVPPEAAETFSGQRRAAAEGWGWLDVVHPDDRVRAERQWREAVAAGEPLVSEVRIRRADGEWRRIAAQMIPIRNGGGNIEEWVGVGEDMTDLRHTEASLLAILDSAFDAIITIDEQGLIVTANAAAHRQFGYAEGELVDQPVSVLMFAPDQTRHAEGLAAYLRTGVRRIIGKVLEMTGRRQDDTAFPIELIVTEFQMGHTRHFTGIVRDISERRLAEQELQLRDRAIQAVSQGILITDPHHPDNPIIFAGGGFERLTGYRPEEAVGRNCRFLQGAKTDPATVAVLREAIRAGRECSVEILNYRKNGTPFWNALFVTPVRDDDGVKLFVGVQADVTERRLLEEQFRQAQKMEAVGQLAGGVAHDFNNLLTVINGYSEMLLTSLPPADPRRGLLAEIHKAGERAGTLTRQLLLFSRQQVLEPKVLNLNVVVSDAEKMLRRLIGEDVRFATKLAPALGPVKVDPGQIEQVLLNLCVNARDAMPTGGNMTIETQNISLTEDYARIHTNVRPGDYTMLAVSDTGTGMDEATKAHIFEPFFTTKGPGKGTGLGLAVVFGVVKQSGGHIEVYTEVGHGTTFKLYFPKVRERLAAKTSPGVMLLPKGTETVLLAEDDEGVRALARHILKGCGYTVLEAGDGREAVRLVEGHGGPLHLLISDVVMPHCGGRQLADQVAVVRPGVKVLFLSGYTDDAVVRHGVLAAEFAFLQKPFTPSALALKVREVLDARA